MMFIFGRCFVFRKNTRYTSSEHESNPTRDRCPTARKCSNYFAKFSLLTHPYKRTKFVLSQYTFLTITSFSGLGASFSSIKTGPGCDWLTIHENEAPRPRLTYSCNYIEKVYFYSMHLLKS